jgi:hypothetical protein
LSITILCACMTNFDISLRLGGASAGTAPTLCGNRPEGRILTLRMTNFDISLRLGGASATSDVTVGVANSVDGAASHPGGLGFGRRWAVSAGGTVEFSFRSSLPDRYLHDLEQLVFFNERQRDVRSRIMELLEQYGVPQMVLEQHNLSVGLAQRPDAQTMFLLSDESDEAELLGFALYLRDTPDTLTVIHVAVLDGITTEDGTDPLLAIRLLHHLRILARRIRGIRWIRVLYGEGSQTRLPVGPL